MNSWVGQGDEEIHLGDVEISVLVIPDSRSDWPLT
jgi:hypothetical protein